MRNLLFGLIYFWLRDSERELNPETARIVREHLDALRFGPRFSNRAITRFVEVYFGEQLDELADVSSWTEKE